MHNPPKLLIVDDEPLNIDYLEQELEDLGYVTVSATNGLEALQQVQAENPDTILLDIMMPEMDGFAVLTQLKADKRWRDLPVIIISAMTDTKSIVKGIKLGAEDYLPKPFNDVLLRARIEACLEKKRWRDQEAAYLQQVERLTAAAVALETSQTETSTETPFDPESLADVAAREDALGHLTRLFQRMVREFQRREATLQRQMSELRIEIDQTRQTQQVNKITGSDYFQQLRSKAMDLRTSLSK